ILIVATLVIGSTAVQAAGSVGSRSPGASRAISPSPSATSGARLSGAAQNFGASQGAPGSISYNPILTGTAQGTSRESRGLPPLEYSPGPPGSPCYTPIARFPSLNSPRPTIPIPSVD